MHDDSSSPTSSEASDPPSGYRYVSTIEAGTLLGIKAEAVRRRFLGGKLQGRRIMRPQGPLIEILVPDQEGVPIETPVLTSSLTSSSMAIPSVEARAYREMLEAERAEKVYWIERAVRAETLLARFDQPNWLRFQARKLVEFFGLEPRPLAAAPTEGLALGQAGGQVDEAAVGVEAAASHAALGGHAERHDVEQRAAATTGEGPGLVVHLSS